MKQPNFALLFGKDPERPDKVSRGQLWTVFSPVGGGDETEMGAIVLVAEVYENGSFKAIPVHATESTRTLLEPVLEPELHTAHTAPIVPVVTRSMMLPAEALTDARYIGEVSAEGLEVVDNATQAYYTAVEALASVQYADAHGKLLSDEEEQAATKAGIYKFCPVNGNIDVLMEFNAELVKPLEAWNMLAIAELVSEEGAAG